jgi:UTP:GlnB (protein PII) uridylyltransferase
MSRIAQKEDLSDADVIAVLRSWWAHRGLTALYLLTVADIRGTSPKVWNAWKGKLLEDLYRLTLRALGGAGPTWTPRSKPASRRRGRTWRCTRPCPAPKSRCGRRWR